MAYWTVQEAAENLNVSVRHIQRLIAEADAMPKQARWRWGRELLDIGLKNSTRRTVRIDSNALSHG